MNNKRKMKEKKTPKTKGCIWKYMWPQYYYKEKFTDLNAYVINKEKLHFS
jgi:hypothetical protein